MKKNLVIFIGLLVVGLTWVNGLGAQEKRYQSTCTLIVEGDEIAIESQLYFAQSRAVLEAVAKKLEWQKEKPLNERVADLWKAVSVRRLGKSRLIQVSAFAEDPQWSKQIAEAVAEGSIKVYTEMERAQQKTLRSHLEKELTKAEQDLKRAEEAVLEFKKGKKTLSPEDELTLLRLNFRLDVERGLYVNLLSRLQDLRTAEALTDLKVRVFEQAEKGVTPRT